MTQALIKLNENINRVLNIVKAKYDLKDKSQTIEFIVKKYIEYENEPELKPEFIEKIKKIKKEKSIRVDDFAKSEVEVVKVGRNNLRWPLAMFAASIKTGKVTPGPSDLVGMGLSEDDRCLLSHCYPHVRDTLLDLATHEEFNGDMNRVAKSRRFDEALKKRLANVIAQSRPS